MKKYLVFALITAIIMSNCFSTAIFAQEPASPSSDEEIIEDVLIPDEVSDVEVYEEAETLDIACGEEEEPNINQEETGTPPMRKQTIRM